MAPLTRQTAKPLPAVAWPSSASLAHSIARISYSARGGLWGHLHQPESQCSLLYHLQASAFLFREVRAQTHLGTTGIYFA